MLRRSAGGGSGCSARGAPERRSAPGSIAVPQHQQLPDAHAGDGSGDHQTLDFGGAFEDGVDLLGARQNSPARSTDPSLTCGFATRHLPSVPTACRRPTELSRNTDHPSLRRSFEPKLPPCPAPKPAPAPTAPPTPTTACSTTSQTPPANPPGATPAASTTSPSAPNTPEPPSSNSSTTSTSASSTPPPANSSASSPSTPPALPAPRPTPRPTTQKQKTGPPIRVRFVRYLLRDHRWSRGDSNP